jgi:hypothetical protein
MGVQREDVKEFVDRIRVSSDDVSALFLNDKLQAGSNMSFNVLDAGGSEVLELDAAVSDDVNPVDVSDDGNSVVTDVDLINFAGGFFTVTNPTGSDVKVIITADSITATELDLAMSPTWTGTHDYSSGGIIVPTSTDPTPTTEGQMAWDSDNDVLHVGNGGGTTEITGGSANPVDVEDDGTSIVTDTSVIDFAGGEFDVTNPTGSEVEVILTTSGVDNSKLANDSITVAGTSVSLGGSVSIALADLSNVGTTSAIDGHIIASDGTDFDSEDIASVTESHVNLGDLADVDTTVGNSQLTNSSVTVSGNSVSLGGSTGVAIADLSDINFGTRTAGQLMIWDDTNNEWVDAQLTEGNATTITNSDGSITIAVDASALAGTLLTSSGGSLDVDEGSIDHDALTNFVSNEHIDHSNVSITAGVALTGGGDLTSSRTIDLDISSLASLGQAPTSDDLIVVRDTSAGDHKEVSISELDNAITDTDTRVDVEDDTTSVITDADAINFGSNLDVTDDGDNSVTVDAQSSTDTRVDVEDDGTAITTDTSILNFKNGYFDITNPTGSEVDVSLTDASIQNAKLVNDSITIAGNSVSLGGSTTPDASDFSGADGTDGQVLTSTGTGAQWEDPSGGDGGSHRNEVLGFTF